MCIRDRFLTECCESLIFKGGTSLSKGFNLIERFSEDIDLAISHSFFGIEKTSKNQREKLRKKARAYIHDTLSIQLDDKLKEMGVSGNSIENVTKEQGKDGEWRLIDSDREMCIRDRPPTVLINCFKRVRGQPVIGGIMAIGILRRDQVFLSADVLQEGEKKQCKNSV